MSTALLDRLHIILTKHVSNPDSGLSAMDQMSFLSMKARVDTTDAAAVNAALVAHLTPMTKRTLASDLLDDLSALAQDVDGAPSFARDTKAEAIAASHALIRSRFQSQGMALPDADPEVAEDEAEADDGWSDMNFGEPEAKPAPSLSTKLTSLLSAGLFAAAKRIPQGPQINDLFRDLNTVNASKNPVSTLALALDRHTALIGKLVPVLASDTTFATIVAESDLTDDQKTKLHEGVAQVQTAIAAGANVYTAVLSAVLEAMPETA